jgi:cytochrome b
MKRLLIWDVPTRLFHWTLALSFAAAWLTSESDQWLSVHTFAGYLMLGLVGFRVVWGLVGSYHARFASFWFGPKAAMRYLREVLSGHAERYVGHNPAGSLAIYLLLLLVLLVGLTGFFTLGGEERQGAAAGLMGIASARLFKKLHEFSATLMLLLVVGHVVGVVVESLLHRENLARSMLNGFKMADAPTRVARPYRWVAGLMLLAMLAFGLWWFSYALPAPLAQRFGRTVVVAGKPAVAFVGPQLADNALWRDECGSCHLSFHPSLLPSRSWVRIMDEQQRHFGSDLALDAPTSAAIRNFLVGNAAERHRTEPALKIDRSIKPDAAPLRITETPYWVEKHRDIAVADWASPIVKSKANCAACHVDAEAGTFEDAAMRLPPRG